LISAVIHRSVAGACPNYERKKKPQLLEQQPDDVAGTAKHCVQGITEGGFQRIAR
jgi:hypothetical protein